MFLIGISEYSIGTPVKLTTEDRLGYTYVSDIEYALRINHAGRSIVEKGCGSDIRNTVPLSLWPGKGIQKIWSYLQIIVINAKNEEYIRNSHKYV